MPRIHPRTGALALGIAGGPASIDGRSISPIGGSCQWLDDETLMFGAPEGVVAYHVPTQKRRVLDTRVPNGLAAADGQWAAFRPDVGVYGSLNNAIAALTRSANAIGAAGADGTLAITPVYQAAAALQLHHPDGKRVRDIPGSVFWDPHVLSYDAVIWDDLAGLCHVDGLEAPLQFGDLGLRFRYVRTPDGPWLVYNSRRWGVVARPANAREGVILADVPGAVIGQMFYHDAAWVDGLGLVVAWSTGAGELPHEGFRVPNVETRPRVDLTPPVDITLTAINRPMWMGFFCGAPGAPGGWDTNDDPPDTRDPHVFPGNGYLSVPKATFFDKDDRPIGTWITSGSVEAIEAQANTVTNTPIVYFDDRNWPRWPNLPDGSWLSVQTYPRAGESVEHLEQEIGDILWTLQRTRPAQRIALVPRVWSPVFVGDHRQLVAAYSRLGARFSNVYAMTPFAGNGRATGLQDHPELWSIWQQLANTITTPVVTVPTVPPKEPPVSSPVTLDRWIHVEYPQLVDAYKQAFGTEPSTEWAAFQSARRGVSVPEGRWPFAKMLAHERGQAETGFSMDSLPTLDGWIHQEFPQLVAAYRQRQGSEPGHEWAAFQTARRSMVVPEGPWSFEKMLAHERAQGTPSPVPPTPTPIPTPQPAVEKYWIKRAGTDTYLGLDANGVLIGVPPSRRQAFELRDLGGNKLVALRARGKYGATENDGRVLFTRDEVGSDWERFLFVRTGAVANLRTDRHGHQLISVDDQGNVRVNQSVVGTWETLALEPATAGNATVAGRLRVDGKRFRNDAGIYRPIWTSALRILSRSQAEQIAFLDARAALGFNGARVFGGHLDWGQTPPVQTPEQARAALPFFLDAARDRGFYVLDAALTDTAIKPYDKRTHVRESAKICGSTENAIFELANEPYHATQDGEVHDPAYLLRLAHEEVEPAGLIYALGAADTGETDNTAFAGGSFVTWHLERGRDEFNMVRGVRWYEELAQIVGKPVFGGEPIKFGSQNQNPHVAFTMGMLVRGFDVGGGVYHSDDGLQAIVPDPGSLHEQLAAAYVEGATVIPTAEPLTFQNGAHAGKGDWPDSPIADAAYEQGVLRVFSFIEPDARHGYTALVGLTGDPRLQWKNDWRIKDTLAARPGVTLYAIER